MKEIYTPDGFSPPILGQQLEVGDRVKFTIPADERVDRPGFGTILEIRWLSESATRIFVIRMDPLGCELCQLPGIAHVTGPKYWTRQVATEENLTWIGKTLSLEICDRCR